MNIYDVTVRDNKNELVKMNEFKGKVLLIVNTATGCGLTPQYKALQSLYEKYKDKGFEILDFPSNQFANQAPGSDTQIEGFCTLNYATTFRRFMKIDVNGVNESDLFKLLKKAKKGVFGSKIKWNFTKFLINKNGDVVGRYSPTYKPENLEKIIRSLLDI